MAKILVVDDEELVRFALCQILDAAGHDVIAASDGRAGLLAFDDQTFDIVVADIIMPRENGIELITKIRKKRPGMKIIAISGGGKINPTLFEELKQIHGADHVLPKPFTESQLLEAVDDCLA